MSTKHTPGPWFSTTAGTVFALHSQPPRNRFSAHIQAGRRDDAQLEELLANARLISAAPDLLAALQAVLDSLGALTKRHELLNYMSEQEADSVFAAIAKALGETS